MRCSTEEVFDLSVGLCDTNSPPMRIKIDGMAFIFTFYNSSEEFNSEVLLFKAALNGMV